MHTEYSHTQTENKSNSNSYEDTCLSSSFLSSLSDGAQRHTLNLGLKLITPNARKGKTFRPPTRESVCLQAIHICVCSSTLAFQPPWRNVCWPTFPGASDNLFFTLIDSQHQIHPITLPRWAFFYSPWIFSQVGCPINHGHCSPHPPHQQRVFSFLAWCQCSCLPRSLLRTFP